MPMMSNDDRRDVIRGRFSRPQSRTREGLIDVDLTGLCLGPADLSVLRGEIRSHSDVLHKIFLFGNSLGDACAAAIARMLSEANVLEVIGLQNNAIGDAGIAEVAEVLRWAPALKELWLNNNNIGNQGAMDAASSLRQSSSITWINLEGNDIGDRGAAAVAQELRYAPMLRVLSMGDNYIGDKGAVAVVRELRHARSLETLSLGDIMDSNDISSEGAADIAQLLVGSPPPSLRKLSGVQLNRHVDEMQLHSNHRKSTNGVILDVLRERKHEVSLSSTAPAIRSIQPIPAGCLHSSPQRLLGSP
mmetsp:Transcript_41198/g.129082  ORF Transcript_41198/g.129082 Transcript_41198/m.129082 type:complete len:303 (-) Transcript_41198:570-1478(-)